jgi:hypothetical protein
MRHIAAVPVAALLASSACSLFPQGECSGGERCNGNVLQDCHSTEFMGPGKWFDVQTCISPQVCRANALGPGALPDAPSATGCFDRNAYCDEGSAWCSSGATAADSWLWSCQLRGSDGTVQWSKANCGARTPPTICFDGFLGTAATGCYEVVRYCQPGDARCDGNVLVACSGLPTVVDGRAVFDWTSADCSQNGMVCKTISGYGPGCAAP